MPVALLRARAQSRRRRLVDQPSSPVDRRVFIMFVGRLSVAIVWHRRAIWYADIDI